MVQDRSAAERAQAFVAAAHAPRQAAGEQEAGDAVRQIRALPALAGEAAVLVGDVVGVGVEDDPLGTRQRQEALAAARPIRVRLALRASSTPQAVKPEREIRIGMPICTVLITISEVSRPVV